MTNDSPITETSRVSKLILVLGSQPAGNQSHKPGDMLPLLSFRHAVTALATKQHCPLAGTKLHLLVTEAHVCVNNLLYGYRNTSIIINNRPEDRMVLLQVQQC